MSPSHEAARAQYDAALSQPAAASGTRAPHDPYGRSLLMTAGDLTLERNIDGLRDLVFVSGKLELVQGLAVLVGTPLGTDILNRQLGLDLTSALGTPAALRDVKELLRLSIVRALAQEPRVRQLQAVAFVDEAAYARIYPARSPAELAAQAQDERLSRRWSLGVLFDTSLGESANLDIAGIKA